MEVFLFVLLLDVLVGYYNKKKGNGFWGAFFVSLLLSPLIGIIVVLIQKPNLKAQEYEAMKDGDLKKCGQCAELVKADARVCRFCQYKFSEAA